MLNLVFTRGVSAAFRHGVHIYHRMSSGPFRVYRVTQLRTDGVHRRQSAGTLSVVFKLVRLTAAIRSGLIVLDHFSWANGRMCSPDTVKQNSRVEGLPFAVATRVKTEQDNSTSWLIGPFALLFVNCPSAGIRRTVCRGARRHHGGSPTQTCFCVTVSRSLSRRHAWVMSVTATLTSFTGLFLA